MKKRQRIYESTDGRCFYCGCKLDYDTFHLDHFIARAKGGTSYENLVPACRDCNLAKSCMDIEEFRDYIEGLLISSLKGRMIKKFFNVKKRHITFYFEEEGWFRR